MDEMRQSLVVLTMEVQESRARAEQDLKSRDDQILHLKNLLSAAIEERDQAQHLCNKLMLDKILLHRHLKHSAPSSAISTIEDDPTRALDGFSSSDCDESIASSPQRMPPEFPPEIVGPLPEKGKFLRAVVQAGPLLQTLLLAGPLPQWRHPPPTVDPCQIPPPPVVLPPSPLPGVPFLQRDGDVNEWVGRVGGKRGLPDGFDWSIESKHQRTDFDSFIELK